MADKYEEKPTVLNLEHGTVTIWHPILTEEERAYRMKQVEKACSNLVKAAIDAGVELAV